ncbi:uncharacterized protein F5891DRAFT_1195609 [Suillus fuscotomentosus]|uniref:DUF6533 domain-containing protein n=1 Tax=Suillus fuscotomentosus TaxID=1912939 RepID=A0AAD4DUI9_9AGAM|nr:uncharacterized protein F5891DRAFT_1195609 [Suillus fuscotomentosus]KAG1894054.1 hypothetical protein F5891DRAFT_1195609 [Suillus fuscotomentosus]
MLDPALISLSAWKALNMGKQSRAAALGLLIYEYVITIEDEIDLIWLKKKSWVTILYHFNRWLPALWLTFDISEQEVLIAADSFDKQSIQSATKSIQYGIIQNVCLYYYDIHEVDFLWPSCVAYLLCNNIAALLTTISVQKGVQRFHAKTQPLTSFKVWAIYDRSRRVLSWMIFLSIFEVAAMALLIGWTIARVERFPVVSTPVGCLFEGLPPLSAIFWTPSLILEPIICILVLKKVFVDRQRRSELATFLACDSLLYFLVYVRPLLSQRTRPFSIYRIFVELVGSTIVWARYPSYIDLFMPWSVALPSLLCNRILLNMRGRFTRGSAPTRSSLLIELATLRTSADSSRIPDEE